MGIANMQIEEIKWKSIKYPVQKKRGKVKKWNDARWVKQKTSNEIQTWSQSISVILSVDGINSPIKRSQTRLKKAGLDYICHLQAGPNYKLSTITCYLYT